MMKKDTAIGLGTMVVTLLLLYGLVSFAGAAEDESRIGCPYETSGNGSDVVIHYLDSESCVWCWMEAPVFDKILSTFNDSVTINKYDIYSCSIASDYGITGTPGWVFASTSKTITHQGYLDADQISSIVCELSNSC